MLRIGLTGGIACGKSTVGEMLVRRGAHYLSADELAHQLYEPGAGAYASVVHAFGRGILNPDQTINRKKLAALAFPDRIDELNAIVHPAVIEAQKRWSAEVSRDDPDGVAVVEAALMFEAGAETDFDKVIVVICNRDGKVERYAQRMGLSIDEARAEVDRRTAAQLSDEDKARRADYVIDNSGAMEETELQVDAIWAQLKKL